MIQPPSFSALRNCAVPKRMPMASDYVAALQHPRRCFHDASLREAHPATDRLGLPRPVSGNFAVVFQLRSNQRSWAVRCFHRHVPDIQRRYSVISDHLSAHRTTSSALVEFRYEPRGILVRGEWFPIVIMDWVEGIPLDQAIESHLRHPDKLRQLCDRWLQVDRELSTLGIAHGDLQHGNILVTRDGIRLVDYDGMFVPALRNEFSNELGHPNYQSPHRTERDFSEHLDRFSSLVIYTALRALSNDPTLWTRYRMPDDAILFRKSDFANPDSSQLIAELLASHDNTVKCLTEAIRTAAVTGAKVNSLEELLGSLPTSPKTNPQHQKPWWKKVLESMRRGGFGGSSRLTPPYTPASSGGVASAQPVGSPTSVTSIGPQQKWWQARNSHKQNTANGNSVHAPRSQGGTAVQPRSSLSAKHPIAVVQSSNCHIVGSQVSRKFHLPTCKYGRQISRVRATCFSSVDEAVGAGFSPCKVCRPSRAPSATSVTRPTPPSRSPGSPTVATICADIGRTVVIQFDDGTTRQFILVAQSQGRPGSNELPIDSPLGRALKGARIGQCVTFPVKAGWTTQTGRCHVLRIS